MKKLTNFMRLLFLICLVSLAGLKTYADVGVSPQFIVCPGTTTIPTCTPVADYVATAIGSPEPTYSYTFTGATVASDTGTGTGSTFAAGTTTVEIIASNSSGSDTCTFDVIVTSVPPSFTSCNSNINVNGNPLKCGAEVTFSSPVPYIPCPIVVPASIPGFEYAGELNGHKYFYSTGYYSWFDAQSLAASYGGYLTSINSSEENAFVRDIATYQIYTGAWIGFTDEGDEGNWRWANGDPVTFTNWNSGEPNNSSGVENCALIYDGTGYWNDGYGYDNLRVIIEFDDPTNPNLISGMPSGSFFPTGITTNTYQVRDMYGQTATCTFTITVADTVPPTIVCPGDQTIHCQSQEFLKPVGIDNCIHNGNSYTYEYTAYEPFDMYTYVSHAYFSGDGGFGVSLPFNFKYFGTEYNNIYLACNGFITFDGQPGVGDGCCNGLPLPDYYFERSIAVNWSDLEGGIYTNTFGSYPNRIFVISWRGSENYHSANTYDVQLALYEGTNEIKIINVSNNGFTSHTKTMGLSNTGNEAIVFDGRNGSYWSASNECITFTPSTAVTQVAGPTPGLFPLGTSSLTYEVTDNSGNTATCSFNITYEPYLSDTVTVGIGGTYPNLTGVGGLFDAINSTGICGQFWVRIISDLEEPGTISLNKITYSNPLEDFVAILNESYDAYYIYGNIPQAMIRLNGADNFEVMGDYNGGYLYFENLNPSSPVLELTNGASGNSFNGCIFASSNSNAGSGVVVLGGTNTIEGNSDNEFYDCTFRNSTASSTFPANLFYSSGNASYPNKQIYIEDNYFINFDQKGIYVTSTGNGEEWEIEDNSFYFTDLPVTKANKVFINFTPGISSYGHYIGNNYLGGTQPYALGTPLQISGAGTLKGIVFDGEYLYLSYNLINRINLTGTGITNFTGFECKSGYAELYENEFGGNDDARITVAGTGTIIGIISSSSDGLYAYDNNIHGVVFTKSSGSPIFKGIQIISGYAFNNVINDITTTMPNISPTIYGICNIASAQTDYNMIFNNMISLNSGKSLKPKVYGIFDQSIGIGGSIFNNTVYISGNTTNGYFTSAFYRIGNASVALYNNIFINTRVANVYAKHYAVHTNSTLNWSSNNNVYYTASACLGNWGGAPYANLTSWRLMTGQDINSIFFLPEFYSVNNLHLADWSLINDTLSYVGTSYITMPFDIDWDSRDNPPTPGADEWYYSGSLPRLEAEPEFISDNESNSLSVYPNPVSSNSTVSINLMQDNMISIELYNMLGEKIIEIANGNYSAGTYNFNINAGNIPSGTYMCRYLINGSESIMKRVQIVK